MMRIHDPDPLSALLRSGDGATPPPALVHGLAEKVRARAKRQRQRRRLAAGCVAVLAAVALTAAMLRPAGGRRELVVTKGTVNEVDVEAQAKRAALEAEVRLAVNERLSAVERRRAQSAALYRAISAAGPTRAERVAAQREQAALTLVDHADRLVGRPGSAGDALAIYHRAIELFPDTPSAEVARQRIAQLRTESKT